MLLSCVCVCARVCVCVCVYNGPRETDQKLTLSSSPLSFSTSCTRLLIVSTPAILVVARGDEVVNTRRPSGSFHRLYNYRIYGMVPILMQIVLHDMPVVPRYSISYLMHCILALKDYISLMLASCVFMILKKLQHTCNPM